MVDMFFWGPRIDLYIIYEHYYKLIEIRLEDPIHESTNAVREFVSPKASLQIHNVYIECGMQPWVCPPP